MVSKMTGIILAGGKNTRIGVNKAFLKIHDTIIIEEIITKLSKSFSKTIVITNAHKFYRYLGVELVKDIIPDKGSLGGIYTALVTSKSHHNFVIACDMPFVSHELIEYMIANAEGYDVIIPKLNNCFEPLHAIYSKNCIRPIKEQLDCNNLKILDFFDKVKVKYISEEKINQFDSRGITFFNINTKENIFEAERIALSLAKK